MIFLAVAFTLCAVVRLPAEESASDTDPIVGLWLWNGDHDVTVRADGTAKQRGEASAEWKLLHTNKTVERNYEFTWHRRGGKMYVQTLVLSSDGWSLNGSNQKGARIWAKKIQ